MAHLVAPVQINVDTARLLDHVGWYAEGYDPETGEYIENTTPANLRTGLATEVARILAPELREEMRDVVRKVTTEVTQTKVAEVVDEVFATGFRKTNAYGEATGPMITVREMVVAHVNDVLERKVDENGRKPDGYTRTSMTYVNYVARAAAKQALDNELTAAADAAVEEVRETVKSIVAAEFGAKVAKAITRN